MINAIYIIFVIVIIIIIYIFLKLDNRNDNGKNVLRYLWVLALLFAVLKSVTSMVAYDEVAFLRIMNGHMIMSQNYFVNILENVENYEGFGTIYWVIYLSVIYPFRKNFDAAFQFLDIPSGWNYTNIFNYTELFGPVHITIIILRILSFIPIIIFFDIISRAYTSRKTSNSTNQRIGFILYILLLLSSPVIWCSGKIAAPDLIVSGILAIAGFYFMENRYKYSYFLLIVGLSFRFSVLPVLLIFIIFITTKYLRELFCFSKRLNLRKSSSFFQCLVGGSLIFILLNYSLLKRNSNYLQNIPPSGTNEYLKSFAIPKLFNDLKWLWFHPELIAWDHISLLSVSSFINPFFLIVIISVFILKRKLVLSLFIFILILTTNVTMIVTGTAYYHWYFYPALFFLIGMMFRSITEIGNTQIKDKFLSFAVMVQVVSGIFVSFNQASISSRWLNTIVNFPNSSNCVRKNIELPILDSSTMGKSVFNDSDYNKWDVVRIFNQNEFLEFNMVVDKRSLDLIDQENKKKLFYSYTLSANCGELQIFEVKPSQGSVN